MIKRRLKKSVVYVIYALTFISVFGSIYFIEKNLEPANTFNEPSKDYKYVSKTIFENDIPVVADAVQIIRPYLATDVVNVKKYYDYKGSSDEQEKALLYYEDTYLQNSGAAYSGSSSFDVVAILDGTVTKVENNNILGNIVEIR